MRSKRPRSDITVALFPFLAVLVCTMGSLIVLLVMVVQQAHLQADEQVEEAGQQRAEEIARLADEFEQHEWRRELLEPQRDELRRQLTDGRSQLSHLEEQIRGLEERWKLLSQQMAAMTDQSPQPGDEAELNNLRAALERTRAEIDQLKKQAANRKDSYAIIPYDGPNGTRRRPIYIECTKDKLIIQPEGLVLTEKDFIGPVGPGNPLDAALRAAREHLASLSQVNPYPLLIVRPDGAQAYAMARHAMRGWEDEFGYELVDGAMELEFEQPDRLLSDKLRRTVKAARQRQVLLAAAMPRQFRGAMGSGFVVRSRGGLAPIGAAGVSASRTGFGGDEPDDRPSGGPHAGRGGDGAGRGEVEPGSNHTTERQPPGAAPSGGQLPEGPLRPGQPGGRSLQGRNQETPLADGNPRSSSDENPRNSAGASAGEDGPGGPASAGSPFGGAIARSRGGNWALPRSNNHAQAVKRPLRVACLPDRLIILPGRNEFFVPINTELTGDMRADVQKFVSRVWKHMEGWGMALAGGYWTPVLNVEVQEGGEENFQALQTLLQDSGIHVTRSQS